MECAMEHCHNRWISRKSGVSFHRFPQDPFLRAVWIEATGWRNKAISHNTLVCSDHFLETDLIRHPKKTLLREGAFPLKKNTSVVFTTTSYINAENETSGTIVDAAGHIQSSLVEDLSLDGASATYVEPLGKVCQDQSTIDQNYVCSQAFPEKPHCAPATDYLPSQSSKIVLLSEGMSVGGFAESQAALSSGDTEAIIFSDSDYSHNPAPGVIVDATQYGHSSLVMDMSLNGAYATYAGLFADIRQDQSSTEQNNVLFSSPTLTEKAYRHSSEAMDVDMHAASCFARDFSVPNLNTSTELFYSSTPKKSACLYGAGNPISSSAVSVK